MTRIRVALLLAAAIADEIVRTYSWCGSREDIGRPDLESLTCR